MYSIECRELREKRGRIVKSFSFLIRALRFSRCTEQSECLLFSCADITKEKPDLCFSRAKQYNEDLGFL